jgi:hypothetical protein
MPSNPAAINFDSFGITKNNPSRADWLGVVLMRLSERDYANITSGTKGKKLKGPKETEIQNTMRDYLRWHGWFVIRHQQSLGSHKGLSDLTAIKGGWTVYIEAKTVTGTLSEDQLVFRDEIMANGGTYVIGRGVDDVKFLCEGKVDELRVLWAGKCANQET